MRILYVTPYPPLKNGIADYAYCFKKALEQFLDVRIDLLDIFQNENIYTVKRFMALGNQIKSLNIIHKYNLIHFEIGVGQNREFYILHFIKRFYPEIPTVVTLHDPPRVLSAPMKLIGIENMPRIIRAIRKILDLTIGEFWENKIFRKVDRVLVLTKKGKSETAKRKRWLIEYVPFIGIAEDKKSKRCFAEKTTCILYFGFLGSKKGVDILVKAFAKFINSDPENKDIKLYVCGGISDGAKYTKFHKRLLRLPHELGIQHNVVFTGWVNDEEKEHYFRMADVLILPYCNDNNNFGASAVLIQGMAYGLPIIVSNVKSFTTEINDGETGILCEPMDVEMLYRKIKLLASDKNLRKKMSFAACEHIRKEHNEMYIANKVIRIYESILQGKVL